MNKVFSLFIFLLTVATTAAYADVSIETSVSRSVVGVGEELTLDIIISNANGQISKPDFPALDGFTSYSQGHSQQLSIINGSMSSTSIFSYVLIANSAGKKIIGPFEVTIGGRTYKAAPVEVDVRPDGSFSQSSSGGGPVTSQGYAASPPPRAMPGANITNQDIFVKAWLDKDEVTVNEPAILTYTIYTRLSATYKGFEKEPVLTGFWVEDFPPEKNVQKTEQIINGMRYVVADVRKIALFPTEAGVFTVDPGVLSSMVEVRERDDFDSFFSYNIFGRRSPLAPSPFFSQVYSKPLPTDKVTLTAKALPEVGKPPHFTGAVGDYKIESSLDKEEVEAGNPVTYRVRITGQGNINTVQPPVLPKMENFKIYDSSSSSNVSKKNFAVEGEKTTETVLVPKKPGSFTIPSLDFSYFDPKSNTYKEIKTQSHALIVKPSAEPEEPATVNTGIEPVEKSDVDFVAKDIQYIKTADEPGSFLLAKDFYKKPIYWILNFLFLAAALLFTFLSMGKESDTRDLKGLRSRRSHRLARQKLKNSASLLKKGKHDEFYAEISKAVHGYFADKLNVPGRSVEFETIESRFGEAEASKKTLEETKELFHELALKRFGQAEKNDVEMKRIYEMADRVITNFEKVKIK